MTQRCHKDNVGVARVDAHLADVTGIGQAAMGPGFTAVGRFVDAVAIGNINADGRLAHADIDDAGIGFGNGNRADRGRFEIAIRDVHPGGAGIGRLPDAAGHRAKVEDRRVDRVACPGDNASAARRANTAPGHGVQ